MRRKVLLVEVNEITWNLIDPLIAKGKLPTFARLKQEGTWATPVSVDLSPHLDPWITWTSIYTGVPQALHGVEFLQQPPESIKAKRIWEICRDFGLKVGIYGSLCSWPPQKVNGFYIPDTFSQDTTTYPPELKPIQDVNLTYTRSIRLPADHDGVMFKIKMALRLVKLGLNPGVIAKIIRQLIREKLNSEVRWQRVALQPLLNFAFFERLYRKYRPDFASYHTNHVAHYQHTYWKAMQPDVFRPQETTEKERRIYGNAIDFGYESADDLLRNMMGLMDENTVLLVASSMGQKPYLDGSKDGRPISQLHSMTHLLEILGATDKATIISTMSDQFNIYANSEEVRSQLEADLKAVYVDNPDNRIFLVHHLDNSLTVNIYPKHRVGAESRIVFPASPGAPSFNYSDIVYVSGNVKSGCHDPKGMMILYGSGIRRGIEAAECNNLDIAPTMLTLLGLPVPPEMKGRVIWEALELPEDFQQPVTQHPVAALNASSVSQN